MSRFRVGSKILRFFPKNARVAGSESCVSSSEKGAGGRAEEIPGDSGRRVLENVEIVGPFELNVNHG